MEGLRRPRPVEDLRREPVGAHEDLDGPGVLALSRPGVPAFGRGEGGVADATGLARGARLRQIPGMTPSVIDLPPGCAFRERCSRAAAACAVTPQESWRDAGRDERRSVRCHLPLAGGAQP